MNKAIAVEKYSAGSFSLSQAAKFAGVSAGEMIEILSGKGIKANYSLKEAGESYGNVRMLCKRTAKK
ncbi:MAG: UPF0175 family protein [Candidatus Altiarchaeota archaeon]|nr:UPF0175 family protein [Candidatus Altiarchaeota archaeon]